MNPSDLEDRLINFAVRVVNVVEALPDSKAGNHIARQLVGSGTSPAPNYGEAQSAESRRDFVHKMKIALKELRETLIWLKIIERKPLCEPNKMTEIIRECDGVGRDLRKECQDRRRRKGGLMMVKKRYVVD
jgi:four helix bundle protein